MSKYKRHPFPSWREKEGVIYFSVTSDGTTGPNWIKRLEAGHSFEVGRQAKRILLSRDFKPTSDVVTKIAVLKGTLFGDQNRAMRNICAKAREYGLKEPDAETACIIAFLFPELQKATGLSSITVMHQPIKVVRGVPRLLCADFGDDCWRLSAYRARTRDRSDWGSRRDGFAFAVSSV